MREPRRSRRRERNSYDTIIENYIVNNSLYSLINVVVNVAAHAICDELQIEKPAIKISDEFAKTGCYVPEVKELHVGRRYANLTTKDDLIRLMEIISHELRHKWQYDNGHASLDDPYITPEEDPMGYREQWVEADAYAYGEEHREELANILLEIIKTL